MKNIVFIVAIKVPHWESRSASYEFAIKSWKYWCDKNNAELMVLDTLIRPHQEMKVNFTRYYAFDLLKDVDFDQLCIVDADSMIHPDTPNFFELTNNKFTVTYADGDFDWICRSAENPTYIFDEFKIFNAFEYFSSCFMVVNKSHELLFKKMIELHDTQYDKIQKLYSYGIGTDQPILNHLVRLMNIDINYLTYQYSMVDLPRKRLLDNDNYLKLNGIYQFNAISGNAGFNQAMNDNPTYYWMKRTYDVFRKQYER